MVKKLQMLHVAEKPNQEKRSLNLSTSAGHETTDTLTTNPLSVFIYHLQHLERYGSICLSSEAESERQAKASDKRNKAKRKSASSSSISAGTKSAEPK